MFVLEEATYGTHKEQKAFFREVCFLHKLALLAHPILILSNEPLARKFAACLGDLSGFSQLCNAQRNHTPGASELVSSEIAFFISLCQRLLHFMIVARCNLDGDTDRQTSCFDCLSESLLAMFQEMNDAVNVCAVEADLASDLIGLVLSLSKATDLSE